MPKIAVIGSTGMLGRAVSALGFEGYEVVEVNRSEKATFPWNQHVQISSDLMGFEGGINLNEVEFVINCAGLIRQKIDENDPSSVESAISANSVIPRKLVSLSEIYDFKILQIGTDCVFSGARGNYLESDIHDAQDLYARTKSMGEIPHKNLCIIRASIVGLELETTHSLMSWLLSQPRGAAIEGFNDQQWNGVTVLQFSKFLAAIVKSEKFESFNGLQHIVPSDSVSKETLLRIIADAFERPDIVIKSAESGNKLNMTLATSNTLLNANLWKLAGYSNLLSIEEMIFEYSEAIKLGVSCGI